MQVPRRRIGTSGPEVSVLSLGSWHTYDRMDFQAAVDLVRAAVDAGVNFFDVGVYGGVPDASGVVSYSYTDVLFGQLMERAGVARGDYLLSEKLWLEYWPRMSFAEQLDRALLRVGTDSADFAVLGDIRSDDIDLHRLVEELGAVVASGRLGGWGVNNWSVASLRKVHEIAVARSLPGPQMAQLKYSLCRRAIADGEPMRELFAETGITLQASDIFEGGILAGNLAPARPVGRDPGGVREQILAAAPRAAEVAAGLGVSAAQLSVAFCLAHPAVSTVLFGVTSIGQLRENLAAVELYQKEGAALRELAAGLWVDRGVVDPEGP